MTEAAHGRLPATARAAGTELDGFGGRAPEPFAHDDETAADRRARRKARWTPADVTEAYPSA